MKRMLKLARILELKQNSTLISLIIRKKLFISGGMGLVALYGISFGNRRTYQWLTAMMVNLFVNKHIVSSTKFHSFCYLTND